jgi:ABC-type uncharacterized transport system permease subunit
MYKYKKLIMLKKKKTSLFLFKIFLAIMGRLHFYRNFRTYLYIFTKKKAAGIVTGIVLNL